MILRRPTLCGRRTRVILAAKRPALRKWKAKQAGAKQECMSEGVAVMLLQLLEAAVAVVSSKGLRMGALRAWATIKFLCNIAHTQSTTGSQQLGPCTLLHSSYNQRRRVELCTLVHDLHPHARPPTPCSGAAA